jgi:hypothetical protein
MRKTIWIPLALGGGLGLLSFISSAVDFLVPPGFSGVAAGPQEIPLLIAAGIGGPLGLLVAGFIHESGIYLFLFESTFAQDHVSSTAILFALADFASHLVALLATAYLYRFVHQRTRKMYIFLTAWLLIVTIYYALLVLLQALLGGRVVPGTPPFSTLLQNFLPEYQVVLILTTLILLALPRRLLKPLWYESKQA